MLWPREAVWPSGEPLKGGQHADGDGSIPPRFVLSLACSDMVHGCMVYTELALRRLQFHVAPAMPAL